jgi:hypothetical protein
METALHAVPHWTVPARRQHALLLESGRVRLLFLASIALPLLVRFAVEERNSGYIARLVQRGALALPDGSGVIFDGRAFFVPPVILSAAPWFLLVPVLWALLVWRGEGRDRRGPHWSMPVAHAAHDGWRVAAGAVWLIAATALFGLTGLGIALLDGPAGLFRYGASAWVNLFTLPLLIYLALSVVTVLASRPLNWLIGIAVGLGAFLLLLERSRWTAFAELLEPVVSGTLGLETATTGGFRIAEAALYSEAAQVLGNRISEISYGFRAVPGTGEWLVATVLWLGLAAGVVVLAARRRP